MPACTLLRAHSSRRTSSDPRPSHVLCGLMKAASHGAVHDAGQPHVDRTGCHARRPLGGITGAGRRGGSSAAGFRWPSLAFRSQIYYFRSSRESEASTCIAYNKYVTNGGLRGARVHGAGARSCSRRFHKAFSRKRDRSSAPGLGHHLLGDGRYTTPVSFTSPCIDVTLKHPPPRP